jgi:hypothetical protein
MECNFLVWVDTNAFSTINNQHPPIVKVFPVTRIELVEMPPESENGALRSESEKRALVYGAADTRLAVQVIIGPND